MGDEGALIDEASVELDEGCAGVEFFLKIVAGEDAADADDGEFTLGFAGDEADDFRAFFAERDAA